VRDLIYREILEYHPQMLADHLSNGMSRGANFMYPSAVDNFRRQCALTLTCRRSLHEHSHMCGLGARPCICCCSPWQELLHSAAGRIASRKTLSFKKLCRCSKSFHC